MADIVDPRVKKSDLIFVQYGNHYSIVEKRLVIGRSPLFAQSKPSKSKDCLSQVVVPNGSGVRLRTWNIYDTYLRTGRIHLAIINIQDKILLFQELLELIDVYLLGEKIDDIQLQNDVMDAILATYQECADQNDGWLPSNGTISMIYAQKPQCSPLRKFLVDVFVWNRAVPAKHDTAEHEDFLRDLISALITQKTAGRQDDLRRTASALMGGGQVPRDIVATSMQAERGIPAGVSCCDYHKHEAGAECGNKKRKRELEEDKERAANKR